ncbi:MAG: hypothetical protein AAGH99_06055 [Planctomycetota bacterium]
MTGHDLCFRKPFKNKTRAEAPGSTIRRAYTSRKSIRSISSGKTDKLKVETNKLAAMRKVGNLEYFAAYPVRKHLTSILLACENCPIARADSGKTIFWFVFICLFGFKILVFS